MNSGRRVQLMGADDSGGEGVRLRRR